MLFARLYVFVRNGQRYKELAADEVDFGSLEDSDPLISRARAAV